MATPTRTRPPVPSRARPRPLPFPLNLYQTAVGKKWVMAITGVVLIGFVIVHMLGNLKVYLGAEDMYHYGEALRDLGGDIVPRTHLLWIMRAGLALAFFLHIHSAYSLTRMSLASRPDRYASSRDYVAANFASRTMRWTGVIVGLFVLFHLADLTWGTLNPDFVRGDPYNNLVASFERPAVAILYILANVALGIHLFHGTWSLFQSLGINNPTFNFARRLLAGGIATIVVVGNVSFPVAVLTGIVDYVEPTYLEEGAALLGQLL